MHDRGIVCGYIYCGYRPYVVGCGYMLWTTPVRRICCGCRYVVGDVYPQHILVFSTRYIICCGGMLCSTSSFTDVVSPVDHHFKMKSLNDG